MQQDGSTANDDAVREKIKRVRELRYVLEVEDFAELSDALSGAGEFQSLCLDLADEAVEREAQAEAIETRIKDLQARKQRVLHSAESLRNVVLQCMDIRGQKTIASASLTLSISTRSPDVVVTDESAIPSRFFTPQPPRIDKKALKESVLDDGEVIDGVSVGNGKISLTIRRK